MQGSAAKHRLIRASAVMAGFIVLATFSGCGLLPTTSSLGSFNPEPAAANVLGCKLLKASAYAYEVNSTGQIQPDTGVATLLGESGDAYGVSSSIGQTDSDRDAVLMWLSDSELIIAFRGTLPFKSSGQQGSTDQSLIIQDWLNDADFTPQTDPQLGPVHSGFKNSFDNLWPGIVQQIKAWQAAGKLGPQTKVYITGHSKGGALAMMAALELRLNNLLPVTEVITFAAPRVGGAEFAAKYTAQNILDYRYENQDDLVPHVPLDKQELQILPLIEQVLGLNGQQTGDYVSVGQLRYITVGGDIISPVDAAAEANLDDTRMAEFGSLLLKQHQEAIDTIINAHAIGDMSKSDTSRYYQAVCGTQTGS